MRVALASLFFCLLSSATSAETRWTMVRTPTLTVIGDQSAAALRDVAVQLEQFRSVVAGQIAGADRPPSLPTNVFVFGTRTSLRPYLPLSSGRPASLAGFFQRDGDVNTIALSLERADESSAVTYHEYTHLLVGNAVRNMPVWLNEGLAEYYSTYRLVDGGREAQIGRPPEGRLALLRQDRLPLTQVIAVDHASALYNESDKRSIFYAEAWALTHFVLTQLPKGGEAINAYVAAIGEGRTPDEAFFAAFGQTPAEFDRILRVYVQRSLYAGTRFTFPEKLMVPEPSAPRVLSGHEANAWLGDLQRRVGRDAEAAPRIDAAVANDPDNAMTHLAAGLLRFTQERTGEGLVEMQRAAALAPNDFETQFLHGVWLLREDLAGSTGNAEPAIKALSRAAALRPESSDAHAWLAYAQMQSERTLADARQSIETAIELAPGRVDHRLRWADVRMLQGEYADARTLLTQLATLRSDPRAADGAQQRLNRLAEFEQRARLTRQPLRKILPGERRLSGRLTRVECTSDGIRFHLDTAGQTIVTPATALDDVEMISYLDGAELMLACGPRPQLDPVAVTTRDGVAVAIEFLRR
jgi:Flp pilus assembly protein TadD